MVQLKIKAQLADWQLKLQGFHGFYQDMTLEAGHIADTTIKDGDTDRANAWQMLIRKHLKPPGGLDDIGAECTILAGLYIEIGLDNMRRARVSYRNKVV
ncbi:hypothetical protein [Kistimonas asteriae]|uniref:hypothetical protein n=1 Tax=Kistimonas asteriae TaxID=517724 RepID=UPI001BA522D2|nr:hypothetical protein [Kistimonas asteriae]